MNLSIGQPVATGAESILAGLRTPDPINRRDERREMAYSKESRDAYFAKYKDPRWQKMRLEVLNRDEFMCRLCFDSKSTLHVHHRWYKPSSDPWEYSLEALVTLCEACHEEETILTQDYAHDVVLILKQAHAMSSQFGELCSIFASTSGAPLSEVDWSILLNAISGLVESRLNDGDLWREAYDRARADWKRKSDELRSKESGPSDATDDRAGR